MKKLIVVLSLALMLSLAACHHVRCAEKAHILAATFPVWLFTANICHDVPDMEVALLIPASAGCPHDFALRPADIQKLTRANVLIINGAGLEEFLTKPLANLSPKPELIDASSGLAVLDGHHGGYNPHIFASPGAASKMVENIARHLAQIYPAQAQKLMANALKYGQELEQISDKLKAVGRNAKNKNIAIEHDAIAYISINAGLQIVAEIESGASPAELTQIRAKLSRHRPALLAGDAQYKDRMLKNLAEELKLPFATLNPCASGPDDAPLDYYQDIMKENLGILEKHFE